MLSVRSDTEEINSSGELSQTQATLRPHKKQCATRESFFQMLHLFFVLRHLRLSIFFVLPLEMRQFSCTSMQWKRFIFYATKSRATKKCCKKRTEEGKMISEKNLFCSCLNSFMAFSRANKSLDNFFSMPGISKLCERAKFRWASEWMTCAFANADGE